MQYSSCCNDTLRAPNSVTTSQTPQFPDSLNRLCASSDTKQCRLWLALQNNKALYRGFP